MIEWTFLIEKSLPSLFFLLLPLGLIYINHRQKDIEFDLDRRFWLKFILVSGFLGLIIFLILVFLTGGITTFYFLQIGFFLDQRSLTWNITTHLKLFIPYDPGVSLFAVSILSGVDYSGLLTTKPYCKIVDVSTEASTTQSTAKQQSAVSSISTAIAGISALASGVVCCSTSLVAFISPAFASFLAPIAPWLIIFSLMMLNLSLFRYVLPRFPTTKKFTENIIIEFEREEKE